MTPDDDIPEHDQLADATRHTLGRLADTGPTDSPSWGAVQSRARRVKTMRITSAVAACVIVVAGIGAVIGTANRDQDHVNVAGPGGTVTTTSEPAPSTSSSPPPTSTTIPRPPATCGPGAGTCGVLGVSPTTPATQPAPSAAPGPSDFKGAIAINGMRTTTASVYAGDDVDIAATIQNITDHEIWPSDSSLPTSVATVCIGGLDRQFLWWMTNVPMKPGERSGRSGTFTPTDADVGAVKCEVVIVSTDMKGTKFDTDAGGDEATATILEGLTDVSFVTITVLPRPDTTTTVPASSGTTEPNTTTTTSAP